MSWIKTKKILSSIVTKIPFLQSLVFFSWQSHKSALPKFIILWLFSSAPVILSVTLSSIPDGSHPVLSKLLLEFKKAVFSAELFVYAASFLSPVLYISIERYKELEDHIDNKLSKVSNVIKRTFIGYGWIWIFALAVLLLTAAGFSATKTDKSMFQTTFLYWIAVQSAPWLYLYASFCWYLSILDGIGQAGDFVGINRENEKGFSDEFTNRVRK
ncbi:MAG: hypothetical protein ABII79_10695 [bacterium]